MRFGSGKGIIGMGHCNMLAGKISEDSERKLVMGGIEALSTTIFAPEIAYVALGHLHLAQQVGDDKRVRYSGTPLPMSFSEEHYQHEVRIIDLAGDSVAKTSSLLIPRTVPLFKIPHKEAKPLNEVLALLAQQQWPTLPEEQQPYLLVRVLLDKPEPTLRQHIEHALEGKAVRLVKIETSYPKTSQQTEKNLGLEDIQRLQPEDVFLTMYQQKFAASPSTELLMAFRDLLSQHQTESI